MDSEYKKGGSYEIPEAGSFPARLVSIIEIGTVQTPFYNKGSFKEGQAPVFNEETGYFSDNKGQKVDAEGYTLDKDGNKELKYAHQISLTFEGQNDDKRFFIRTRDITLSLNEKAVLSKYIEQILGRKIVEGDVPRNLLQECLGKPCIVTVAHTTVKDKTYANLTNVTAPMKGMTVLEAKTGLTFLNFKDWDETLFAKLPEFVQTKIKSSYEYQEMVNKLARKASESKNAALAAGGDGPTTWVDEFGVEHTIPF